MQLCTTYLALRENYSMVSDFITAIFHNAVDFHWGGIRCKLPAILVEVLPDSLIFPSDCFDRTFNCIVFLRVYI